jgi:Flp pilus assembly protein TadG
MTAFARKLRDNALGAAAIEFALAVPILVSLIWGLFQVGLVFQANAGVQHALGQAARYATIWPTPTDTQLQTMITSSKFGVSNGTWSTPTISALDTTDNSRIITVSYSQPMQFLFFTGPSVTITKTKKVYIAT